MTAGNSTLNLALRITADLEEASRGLESLSAEIKTTGANAETSNKQWKSAIETQQAATEAARQHAQMQQALSGELNTSIAQSQRAARSAEEVTAAWSAQSDRGHALYREQQKVAQAEEAAAKAAEAHAKEVDKLKKDLDGLLGSIDPASKALGKLDAQEAQLRKSYKSGLIDEGAFNDYLGKLNDQRTTIDHLSEGTEKLALNSRSAGRELRVLVHQLAQGNFRDASNNILSLGSRTGMLPPLFSATTLAVGGTVAAIVGAVAAVTSVLNDQEAFNRSIQLTGNYAGVTTGQLEMMTQAGGQLGSNYSQVRDILNGLVSSGKFTGETLSSVSQAASVMAQLTGQSADQVVGEFVKMTDSASEWARNSSEQYHWLDSETYQRIRALEEQGRTEEAIELTSQKYKEAMSERLVEIEGQLNWVARGWLNVKKAAAEAVNGLKSGTSSALNLDSPAEARVKEIKAIKDWLAGAGGSDIEIAAKGPSVDAAAQRLKDRLSVLEAMEAAETKLLELEASRQKTEKDAITASKELEKTRYNNLSEMEKEAAALDELKKKYQAMWASEGTREGPGGLRDLGVTSEDGINFKGGQWDIDAKALDKSGQKAKQYNEQLQRQLDLKTANTNAAKVEYEIEHGLLKNATEEAQSDARVRAEILDEEIARQKAAKASAAETKKSFAENQRFVDQLVKQATKRTEGAAALRAEEIATRNLTAAQREAAEAANAAINAREFKGENLQLQLEFMRAIGDTAGASLLQAKEKFAELRTEFEASGNTEGLNWLDKLLPVTETKIRVDDIKKQLEDLFTYQSQQESSIQAQVQGGLLSELQGRQRLIALHQEVGDKVKAYLPQLKEMADLPGEAGEKIREMIRQLEEQLGKLNQAGNELTIAFRDGLQSGIESSLMGLAKGTMNLSDAVRNLALSIVDSMAKIAAQQLAMMATSSLMGPSGGMGGVLGSLFAATGGHIQGPGTSTSDSIPAMLSNNEFVTRAAVVQQPGALSFLHDFNREGMAALAGWIPRIHHATGGLAGIPAPAAIPMPEHIPETRPGGSDDNSSPQQVFQQTLVFDAAEAMSAGFGTVGGQRAAMTFIRAFAPTIRQELGVK
ncbi:tail length tape measure protein [Serratia fonticola]|uniref:Tail length tape measure protein n=1 Tax=Serratia fonticola TaxID=47917 RepID=A0A542D869_SERFO|nr:phage tail length tape measure family protein [Serratia fonticola]TQI78696.1 tail length tape measure protein [Serratia fonticola]TQI99282.1 tail length tape measure protein [Serratia fonticola]TVZ68807.1 tail length tape measure protein [Serratia fonticola]